MSAARRIYPIVQTHGKVHFDNMLLFWQCVRPSIIENPQEDQTTVILMFYSVFNYNVYGKSNQNYYTKFTFIQNDQIHYQIVRDHFIGCYTHYFTSVKNTDLLGFVVKKQSFSECVWKLWSRENSYIYFIPEEVLEVVLSLC